MKNPFHLAFFFEILHFVQNDRKDLDCGILHFVQNDRKDLDCGILHFVQNDQVSVQNDKVSAEGKFYS